jgi:hypothetical protein
VNPRPPASGEVRRQLAEIADRPLTAEEVRAYLAVPVSDEQRDEILALVDWFCRRYPTPAERLAYVRRAYRRWTASRLNEI